MRLRNSAFGRPPFRWKLPAVLLVALALLTTACGGDPGSSGSGSTAADSPTAVRLGYFPNVTHATALVGVESGIFKSALGANTLQVKTFSAGPAAVEALFSGGLDAAYIGPNPAINAHVQSGGEAIRIISGATSGGASLVVRPSINTAADLKGKKLASPQRGGTQDVALRHWLKDNHLKADLEGGGDVSIVPQENAQTLETFRSGQIDGGWVPEPWATRLVQEGGGKVLLDERTLWPDGKFVTTHLVVRTKFLKEHPDAVRRLVEGQVQANELVNGNPAEAQRMVNQAITTITGKGVADSVLQASWKNLQFTNDPIASSLTGSADHAHQVGVLGKVDLKGIYDLTHLNQVLQTAGQPEGKG
ncbi:MAG: ABC transporter substrate-binding protein [Actinomycetota bacterium]|nr:ABC transporter substrate-binding protein [Actinomycetota bacterium]